MFICGEKNIQKTARTMNTDELRLAEGDELQYIKLK